METVRKSRYCFLIDKEDVHLAYSSATNSFYKTNGYVNSLIRDASIPLQDIEAAGHDSEYGRLRALRLITTEEEDDRVVDLLRIKYFMHSFSKESLGIIIAPTLKCNLRCPYCYEANKPAHVMDKETCDRVIDFIKGHSCARSFHLMWYGGEPMVGADVIKYILSRVDELEDIKMKGHGMITNATLLSGDNLDIFKEHPLDHVQITLDGNTETHDTRRIRHDGVGTYDKIIENMKGFAESYPDTSIAVRVNIDKDNASEFMTVYETVRQQFPGKKNIFVYPGILRQCGKQDVNSPFLMNEDVMRIKDEFVSKGFPMSFPNIIETGCTATSLTGYIIGPQGELYKCWEDIGMPSRVVGNIRDRNYTNMKLFSDYMLHGTHILEEECRCCPLLPICSNDCARHRLDNRQIAAGYELCSLLKSDDYRRLEDELYLFYSKYVNGKDSRACTCCE